MERFINSFNGRYNINELLDLLENNIDIQAGIFLMLATRADQVTRKIADKISKAFLTIAGVIAFTPIPLSDIIILMSLQVLLTWTSQFHKSWF